MSVRAAHAAAGVRGKVRSPPGSQPTLAAVRRLQCDHPHQCSHPLCAACSVTTPTGALTLDLALGGGYPKGRVVEIYGPGATAASDVFCCGWRFHGASSASSVEAPCPHLETACHATLRLAVQCMVAPAFDRAVHGSAAGTHQRFRRCTLCSALTAHLRG